MNVYPAANHADLKSGWAYMVSVRVRVDVRVTVVGLSLGSELFSICMDG